MVPVTTRRKTELCKSVAITDLPFIELLRAPRKFIDEIALSVYGLRFILIRKRLHSEDGFVVAEGVHLLKFSHERTY